MIQTNLYTKSCFILVFILYPVTARKYDVETEAMRLYGQDFKSVIAKFRRTPDYLQILGEKYNEMTVFFSEIATYALQYTVDNKLKKRVADFCDLDETTTTKYYYKARDNEILERPEKPENPGNPEDPKPPEHPLPDYPDEVPKTSRNPIDLLEQYSHFKNILSIQERNTIRDLAFEITGHMIHMIIQSMGPVEGMAKSTRLPFGGDHGEVFTTTENDHRHKITKAYSEDSTQTFPAKNPDTSGDDTYRFRYKHTT